MRRKQQTAQWIIFSGIIFIITISVAAVIEQISLASV